MHSLHQQISLQSLTSCSHADLPQEDVALWEVLLDECTSYQPQPAINKEEQESLVEEVSGDLMQPGAIDPAVDDDGQAITSAADAAAPRLTRIASGEPDLKLAGTLRLCPVCG